MLYFEVNLIEACKRESPITNSMEYFLATGNLVSKHGLGILQVKSKLKLIIKILEIEF